MPFGMSKKDKDKDQGQDPAEEKKRSALFGGRSKSSKSAAPQANPYAVQTTSNDPYASKPAADPYASKPPPSTSSYNQPPPYNNNGSMPDIRRDKSPVPPGGYGGAPQPQRYGGGGASYGQQSGYGNNAYGNEPQPSQSRYGPSGYGGLGRSNSQETTTTDAGRAALFGDAPQRQLQVMEMEQAKPEEGPSSSFGGYGGTTTATANTSSFGGYGEPERELTAEEQEEEDVQAAKNEIRFIKQQDVAATRNARRIAEQTEAIGRETLARLGQQGDRIHNTERNLDLASHQNRLAEEKARELKTLNRSMFAMHVSNPFTAKKREEAANAIALDKHRQERLRADETRANAYSTTARQQGFNRELNGGRAPQDKASLAQRSKYQFEADSEDDEMENEIDDNLDAIHRGAKTLNQLGKAMGQELDEQNKHIGRIIGKTDLVDDEIAVNRARLDRISKRG
ncbi:hypothetical protein MBLNU457_7815t1 [Dothideomycetes sp. NU457]